MRANQNLILNPFLRLFHLHLQSYIQKELETCVTTNQVKTEDEKLKLELEKEMRIVTFTETNSKKVYNKLKTVKLYIDSLINDIKETIGELLLLLFIIIFI